MLFRVEGTKILKRTVKIVGTRPSTGEAKVSTKQRKTKGPHRQFGSKSLQIGSCYSDLRDVFFATRRNVLSSCGTRHPLGSKSPARKTPAASDKGYYPQILQLIL